jgi:hypothetical protein
MHAGKVVLRQTRHHPPLPPIQEPNPGAAKTIQGKVQFLGNVEGPRHARRTAAWLSA